MFDDFYSATLSRQNANPLGGSNLRKLSHFLFGPSSHISFFFPDILTFYTNVNKHMLMQHGILWNWNIWLLKLKRSICIERPGLYYLYWDKTYLQTTKKEWKTKIFIGPASNLRLLEASYKAMKITKVSYLKLNIMNV